MNNIEGLNENVNVIEDYKKQYGDLYMTTINGESFVWKIINREEFNKLGHYFKDEDEREKQLCRLSVIDPEDYDFEECEAGITFTLSNQIIRESGFTVDGSKIKSLLNEYRGKVGLLENYIDAVITEAFPNIRLEEIDTWPIEKIIRYYTIAEYRLTTFRGIKLSISDGKEEPQQTKDDLVDFPELRGR